jgi:hypothetical protein
MVVSRGRDTANRARMVVVNDRRCSARTRWGSWLRAIQTSSAFGTEDRAVHLGRSEWHRCYPRSIAGSRLSQVGLRSLPLGRSEGKPTADAHRDRQAIAGRRGLLRPDRSLAARARLRPLRSDRGHHPRPVGSGRRAGASVRRAALHSDEIVLCSSGRGSRASTRTILRRVSIAGSAFGSASSTTRRSLPMPLAPGCSAT